MNKVRFIFSWSVRDAGDEFSLSLVFATDNFDLQDPR